jgi:hypothetical protein
VSERATCPSCRQELVLSFLSRAGPAQLTCPRCLAAVPVPAAGPAAAAPQAPEGLRADTPPQRAGPAAALDTDVRRDARGAHWALVVLAVLGGIGTAFALAFSYHEGHTGALAGVLVALLFLAVVSFAVLLVRNKGDLRAAGPGRVLLGTFALAGGILFAGPAGVILLFAMCSAC